VILTNPVIYEVFVNSCFLYFSSVLSVHLGFYNAYITNKYYEIYEPIAAAVQKYVLGEEK